MCVNKNILYSLVDINRCGFAVLQYLFQENIHNTKMLLQDNENKTSYDNHPLMRDSKASATVFTNCSVFINQRNLGDYSVFGGV